MKSKYHTLLDLLTFEKAWKLESNIVSKDNRILATAGTVICIACREIEGRISKLDFIRDGDGEIYHCPWCSGHSERALYNLKTLATNEEFTKLTKYEVVS